MGTAFSAVTTDIDREVTSYRAAMDEINATGAQDLGPEALAGATKALQSTLDSLPELQVSQHSACRVASYATLEYGGCIHWCVLPPHALLTPAGEEKAHRRAHEYRDRPGRTYQGATLHTYLMPSCTCLTLAPCLSHACPTPVSGVTCTARRVKLIPLSCSHPGKSSIFICIAQLLMTLTRAASLPHHCRITAASPKRPVPHRQARSLDEFYALEEAIMEGRALSQPCDASEVANTRHVDGTCTARKRHAKGTQTARKRHARTRCPPSPRHPRPIDPVFRREERSTLQTLLTEVPRPESNQ